MTKKELFKTLKDVPEDFEIRLSDEGGHEYDFDKLEYVWECNKFAIVSIEKF